jgi:hypothetical protein
VAPAKKLCPGCGKNKALDQFGWARRKRQPTKFCKACWTNPREARNIMGRESAKELVLFYTPIRELMRMINDDQERAQAEGDAVDHPIASLDDIWLGEMTEEVYRAILKALIKKASQGDQRAAELLFKERARRFGGEDAPSDEEGFEELFSIDPLTPGLDSE